MNTALLKTEVTDEIIRIQEFLSESQMAAVESAIEAVEIFMKHRHHCSESYVNSSMQYIGKYFHEIGEEGLLLVAAHFPNDTFFLQALVKSNKIIGEDNVVMLAKISRFDEAVCGKIVDSYTDESLIEKLIGEMIKNSASSQIKVIARAIKKPYVSDHTARKLSRPFKDFQEISILMMHRIQFGLQKPETETRTYV